ncbi:hypothetical protein OG21DRAFT_1527878 [Imleria badia]|nr:hypothetical protein OG21DRAFT_1527878 [Imleria badia]
MTTFQPTALTCTTAPTTASREKANKNDVDTATQGKRRRDALHPGLKERQQVEVRAWNNDLPSAKAKLDGVIIDQDPVRLLAIVSHSPSSPHLTAPPRRLHPNPRPHTSSSPISFSQFSTLPNLGYMSSLKVHARCHLLPEKLNCHMSCLLLRFNLMALPASSKPNALPLYMSARPTSKHLEWWLLAIPPSLMVAASIWLAQLMLPCQLLISRERPRLNVVAENGDINGDGDDT